MDGIKKYQFIDETRGIAILIVIWVHAAMYVTNLTPIVYVLTSFGQMGVQLFFIASAYTLCHSFSSRSNEPHAVKAFYIRRLFRIAPLYWVGIGLYFVVHVLSQLGSGAATVDPAPYLPLNVLANVFFVHGFVPSANNHIVPGGWSIGTEMAFYLIFPLLYRFLDKKPGKRILMAALSFAAAAIGNLAIQYLILAKTAYGIYNNSFLYFNLINQLPVFLLGFLYFFLVKDTKRLGALLASRALGIVGFAACTALSIAILLFFRQQLLFALLPTVAGCAFVFLVNLLRIKRRPLGLVGKIGKVSYSMYIFHFLFAWMLVPWMFRGLPAWISPDLQLVLAFGLSVAGSYLIAIITERFIEEGGIAMGGRIIQKFKPDRCIMPVAE